MPVTSGAAQGSILGPDLWNINYDGILRMEMPQDTFLVGYADDVAAVITGRNVDDVKRKLNQVMIRTKSWLEAHGLQLATHKTELLLLTRRHMPTEIDIDVDGTVITTKSVVKYLGLRLDSRLTFTNQLKYTAEKAGKTVTLLNRLMANIGGPLPSRRKLLMETINSVLLYGCEIWGNKMNIKERAKTLLSVQRTAALRITSAYRTVSASAVFVIAGVIPIDLRAIERRKIWEAKQTEGTDIVGEASIQEVTIQSWQLRWNADTSGRWTARLIPDIDIWLKRRNGEVNYYLTQMLSGHGYFRKYLHKIGKCSTPYCLYEQENVIDDAEHTFFNCSHWSEYRMNLENRFGQLTADNIVVKMISNEETWRTIAKYCETILRIKKTDLDLAV